MTIFLQGVQLLIDFVLENLEVSMEVDYVVSWAQKRRREKTWVHQAHILDLVVVGARLHLEVVLEQKVDLVSLVLEHPMVEEKARLVVGVELHLVVKLQDFERGLELGLVGACVVKVMLLVDLDSPFVVDLSNDHHHYLANL
jgi:hypothetical protein